MDSIPENVTLANLPVAELSQSLSGFLEPLMEHLPPRPAGATHASPLPERDAAPTAIRGSCLGRGNMLE